MIVFFFLNVMQVLIFLESYIIQFTCNQLLHSTRAGLPNHIPKNEALVMKLNKII